MPQGANPAATATAEPAPVTDWETAGKCLDRVLATHWHLKWLYYNSADYCWECHLENYGEIGAAAGYGPTKQIAICDACCEAMEIYE